MPGNDSKATIRWNQEYVVRIESRWRIRKGSSAYGAMVK